MLQNHDANTITTEAELRTRFSETMPISLQKAHNVLNHHDKEFIARSPFLVLGTSDGEGRSDVSPRGDPPGFVKVIDDQTIAIPDRPGNNRLDSLSNIIAYPAVGLIFMVPGFDDTLRINGKATLTTAPELLETMAVRERVPTLAIKVRVEEVFLHCAKAFKRSKLWAPESIQDRKEMPTLGAMILEVTNNAPPSADVLSEVDAMVEEAYVKNLY